MPSQLLDKLNKGKSSSQLGMLIVLQIFMLFHRLNGGITELNQISLILFYGFIVV
jgi:hypothetical protein